MSTKAEREHLAEHKEWLDKIGTLSLRDIAENLLEDYKWAQQSHLSEYGDHSDVDELGEEVIAYRIRLAVLKALEERHA
jgi:hypothetical protein